MPHKQAPHSSQRCGLTAARGVDSPYMSKGRKPIQRAMAATTLAGTQGGPAPPPSPRQHSRQIRSHQTSCQHLTTSAVAPPPLILPETRAAGMEERRQLGSGSGEGRQNVHDYHYNKARRRVTTLYSKTEIGTARRGWGGGGSGHRA